MEEVQLLSKISNMHFDAESISTMFDCEIEDAEKVLISIYRNDKVIDNE